MMFEQTLEPIDVVASAPCEPARHLDALHNLLLGNCIVIDELPPLPDLIAGVCALATAERRRVILPLAQTPVELALVRHGQRVHVDCYSTQSAPEIYLREHPVDLANLMQVCVAACRHAAAEHPHSTAGQVMDQLGQRVMQTAIVADDQEGTSPIYCTGGSLHSPGERVPLAFGFHASIQPKENHGHDSHSFADVHAMLFEGRLWAFNGTRRVPVFEGPIMLAAQRMVAATRALLDAWQADRALSVRLRSGKFSVAVRRNAQGMVTLALSTAEGPMSWPALDVPSTALPILRLASDMIRKLITVDRNQLHNLRIADLRREVRELRRVIRTRQRLDGFENSDPERLRLSSPEPEPQAPTPPAEGLRGLRYTERWSAEIDALDANGIYPCGERLLVTTGKLTLALDRNDGGVLWSRPTARASSMMAGKVLVRVLPDGLVELCEVEEGSVYAKTRIAPKAAGTGTGILAGGNGTPPMAVLSEGRNQLVAIDLRTGQARWRFRARGDGQLRMRRSGRVLLISSGGGCLDAVDTATGEVVWRYSDSVRFCLRPAIDRDVVVAASGEPGGGAGALYGIGLYSGQLLWRRELGAAPSNDPIEAPGQVIVPSGSSRWAKLTSHDCADGNQRWQCSDPGMDSGGQALVVDDNLVINTSRGRLVSLSLQDGEAAWSRALSNPLTDDVPRQLSPVLRQGALFVPSAQVHVLRPSDGSSIAPEGTCDLVPDCLRVDERGWFYVAEESGHLRAYAAAPHLSLVK